MIQLSMTVHHGDGREQQVTVTPVTQVAFERHFKTGIAKAFSEAPLLEHVYWMAWHAARPGVEFDPWLESVASIDFGVEVADPTQPTASDT